MPGLYGITGNTSNVAVTNTTGLYSTTSTTPVLNSAQQLLTILDNNGNVQFALDPTTGYTTVYSYFTGNGGGGGGGGATLTLYGDVNAVGSVGSPIATVLTATGVTAGTYGNATYIPSLTVDTKGRVVNISTVEVASLTYGNANVAAYLPTYTGALTAANVTTTGNVTADFFIGDGSLLSNLPAGVYSNTNVTAYLTTATISTTGNIATSAHFIGDGSLLTNLPIGPSNYGNANVAAYMPSYLPTYNGALAPALIATNTYLWANGQPVSFSGGGSSYGNANVAVYLASNTDATITSLWANDTLQQSEITAANAAIAAVSANLTSFETYANATYSTIANAAVLQGEITAVSANLTSFETYANATYATIATTNNLQTEITGLQTQVTANATALSTLSANVGAFEAYANATFQHSATAYGNANVAAYLPLYTGTLGGNITIGGNLTVQGNIITNNYEEVITGLVIANSATAATSTTTGALQSYGGAGIQGNLFAGSVYTNTYNYANGTSIFTGINSSIAQVQTNLTAYETVTNATIANIESNVTTLQSNVGNVGNVNIYEISSNNSMSSLTLVDFSQIGFQEPFITGNVPGDTVTSLSTYPLGGSPPNSILETTSGTVIITGPGGIWTANTATSSFNNTLYNSSNSDALWVSYQDTTGNVWVGGSHFTGVLETGLWLSQNSGQTWTYQSSSPFPGVGGQMTTLYSSGGPTLVVTTGNQNTNLYTSSNGLTWTQSSDSTLPSTQYGIIHVTGFISLLGGNDGIYRSTTGTSTWTKVQSTPAAVCGFCNTGTSIIAYCDGTDLTNGGILWRSTDNGVTWTNVYNYTAMSSGINGFRSMACHTDPNLGSVILAGAGDENGGGQGTLRSTDDGRTWDNTKFDGGFIYAMATVNGNIWLGSNDDAIYIVNPLPTGLTYNATNNTIQANLYAYGNVTANAVYTTSGIFWSGNGAAYGSAASSYGNTQVAAYLASGIDPTITTIQTNITSLQSNAVNQEGEISLLNANVTAANAALSSFETYANATYATITTTNNLQTEITSNASLITGLQTQVTANAALITGLQSQMTSNAAIITNLQTEITANAALITGLQTQMTANAALITGLQTQVTANASTLSSLQANVGSFYTYANSTYATQASLTSFETYANTTFQKSSGAYGNANVVALLPTYGGNLGGTLTTASQPNITGLTNAQLAHSSVTVSPGTGLSGGGAVSLGSSITLNNTGVLSITAGTGIVANASTGAISINNSGVTSLTAGGNISISASTGGVTISSTNSGVTGLTAGSGISLSGSTGNVTITATGGGGSGLSWQSVQTSNFTATANDAYPINTTSAAITATLPASPTAGQAVSFTDYAGTFATNNLTVNPNGANIDGQTDNVSISTNRETVAFVYIDSTQGWIPYSGFNTSTPSPIVPGYTASYLVVAGGGGGGTNAAGGGGAGGLLSGTASLLTGTTYTITVGAGGAATSGGSGASYPGGNSVVTSLSLTAIGGGQGGDNDNGSYIPGNGGSGGGGGCNPGSSYTPGGSGTTGQGNTGGEGYTQNDPYSGGGGGGAGSSGGNASSSGGGAGGSGTSSSITGSSVTYAGGGGGGTHNSGTTPGSGGSGGGGAGGNGDSGTAGGAGTANSGGGGGGGGAGGTTGAGHVGQNGGSGVVILSVPTANYSGTTTGSPTITTSGSNTIIKFTASGSYTA